METAREASVGNARRRRREVVGRATGIGRGAPEVGFLPDSEDSAGEGLDERSIYADAELPPPVYSWEDPLAGCRGVLAGCVLVLPLIPLVLYGAALLIKAGWVLVTRW